MNKLVRSPYILLSCKKKSFIFTIQVLQFFPIYIEYLYYVQKYCSFINNVQWMPLCKTIVQPNTAVYNKQTDFSLFIRTISLTNRPAQ